MVWSSIFGTELQSGGAGPYGPVFLNGLQKRPRSRPDRTVASLLANEFTAGAQSDRWPPTPMAEEELLPLPINDEIIEADKTLY